MASYVLRQPDKDRALGQRLTQATQEVPRFGYRRSGSDMRLLGAVRPNNVCSDDFVHDRLAGKRTNRLLCVLDEFTRESLAIEVATSLTSQDAFLTLARLMRLY